jgi:alpha-amylase
MPDVSIYCQVHQPYRLRRFRVFDIGRGVEYFDDAANRSIVQRVAAKCYVPANRLLADLIRRSDGEFRMALSLSGVLLEQLAAYAPEALESFQELVATGGVELLGETYYHSLSALVDPAELRAQVRRHTRILDREFGAHPQVFRNTELIYSDALAPLIAGMGFRAAVVEGADRVLGWRSPNHVYEAATAPGLRLLPRNYRLSDDVAFRFSERSWSQWPLTVDKYADWIAQSGGDSVHLFIDYETLGEHQWEETGIFEFVRHLPAALAHRSIRTVHPSTLAARTPVGALSFPTATSWADLERDVSAWLGNGLQESAQRRLYRLAPAVRACHDAGLLERWRRLTTSDHLYYMATKWAADGDVHTYFSPYDTPYDAFIAFMNAMQDLEQIVAAELAQAAEAGLDPEVELIGASTR